MNRLLLEALTDLHMTLREKPLTDFTSAEFYMRARPMVEKFERDLRATGTMDKTTFVHSFTWFFFMAATYASLSLVHPDTDRRIAFTLLPIELGRRKVRFSMTQRECTPEEAAEVVWLFLQGEPEPESSQW